MYRLYQGDCLESKKAIEAKVIELYIPYKTTLRKVGVMVGIDHHRVKRILSANGIPIVRGSRGPFTDEHRANISKGCMGREGWMKGQTATRNMKLKNMSAHIRFDVSWGWLDQFEDLEKIKVLNDCITNRSGRFNESSEWYMAYLLRFYICPQFNLIYGRWVESGKGKYLKPSIDHVIPRSKGGTNEIGNLQFLTWFENRCKNDMSQAEWERVKSNLDQYLVGIEDA